MLHQLPADPTAWFTDARFGLFVHWGLYSVHGRGEWAMNREAMPWDEYERLLAEFTAADYDPHSWAAMARDAGMKYAVLTTKHHEGFCLWPSKVCDFNVTRSGAGGRDLVGEFVDAFRTAGLKAGLYYSLGDWRHPGWRNGWTDVSARSEFIEWTHAMVGELSENYTPDVMWYDLPQSYTPHDWRSVELNAMVRQKSPGVLINNRAYTTEDFATPEQGIVASAAGRPWEVCMTLNDSWGYNADDMNYKTSAEIANKLVICAAGGGNLLLNVGPDARGNVPTQSKQILSDIGGWLRTNGEAIYDVERHSLPWLLNVGQTVRDRTLYLHFRTWPGKTYHFGGLQNTVQKATLLGTDTDLQVSQSPDANPVAGSRTTLRGLPADRPAGPMPVVRLDLDGPPRSELSKLLNAADVHPVLPA